jgi:hypothetical protein
VKNEKLEVLVEALSVIEASKRRAARHENRAKDKDDQLFWEGQKLAFIGVEEYLRSKVAQEYKRVEQAEGADVIPLKKKADAVKKAN